TREGCRRALEDEGYRVILASDAIRAVNLWRSERPDVVILDNLLSRQGALDAAERISSLDLEAPIILYAGYDDAYLRDPRAGHFMACVEKSKDFAELTLAVVRVLTSYDQARLLRVGLPPA